MVAGLDAYTYPNIQLVEVGPSRMEVGYPFTKVFQKILDIGKKWNPKRAVSTFQKGVSKRVLKGIEGGGYDSSTVSDDALAAVCKTEVHAGLFGVHFIALLSSFSSS